MSSGSPNAKLFINYRREDTAPYAGRLYDRLTAHFGEDQVFIDIDQIEPGEDFVEAINRKVSACDIAIVSIGPDWLSVTDASGNRRLDDKEDFVRMEIVAALQRKIRVIPILVGGARMPRKQDLPEDLAPLSRRNALELSETRFHADVDRLIEAIEKPRTLPEKKTEPFPAPVVSGAEPAQPEKVPETSGLQEASGVGRPVPQVGGPRGSPKPNYGYPRVLIAVGTAIMAACLIWFVASRLSRDSESAEAITAAAAPSDSPEEANPDVPETTPTVESASAENGSHESAGTEPLTKNAPQKSDQTEQAQNDEWRNTLELYEPETWLPQVRKNADDGLAEAQFAMGVFYEFGLKTLRQDSNKAAEWYRKAAAQGHVLAQEGWEDLTRKGGAASGFEAVKLDVRRQSRQQAILSHVLNEMDQKAREAIKSIKAG